MNFELTGTLIEKYDTQEVTSTFKKREFVLEHKEEASGREFINFIKFQAIQDRCQLLDNFNLNDSIKVSFSLKGRKWEKAGQVSYFTNLEAWRIESAAESAPKQQEQAQAKDISVNDLPPLPDDYNDLPF